MKLCGVKAPEYRNYYGCYDINKPVGTDGRVELEIVDVTPWGGEHPTCVGKQIRVLSENLAYIPVLKYFRPGHPKVVAYDNLNMSEKAISNIRVSHAAKGFSGVGNIHQRRLLEIPSGFMGASIYFDFVPPEAVPLVVVNGYEYFRDNGISAMHVANSLLDAELPPPSFAVHTVPSRATKAPSAVGLEPR